MSSIALKKDRSWLTLLKNVLIDKLLTINKINNLLENKSCGSRFLPMLLQESET